MKRTKSRRLIAGVVVLALLVLLIASVTAGCGQNQNPAAGSADWNEQASRVYDMIHIPELVPDSSTATESAPEYSHNLLVE